MQLLSFPRSHEVIITYAVVEKGMENKGQQRRTKVNFGRTMMWALELLWLAKKPISGRSDVEQLRDQAHSLSGYLVTLVWRQQ